jgi:hypothetical protein
VRGRRDRQAVGDLASSASDREAPDALKYVVHLVADVHQPLHAGYADDRGGNTYQVQALGRGTNLHALWDSGLIENTGLDTAEMTAQACWRRRWLAGRSSMQRMPLRSLAGSLVRLGSILARKAGADYVERFTPVVETQLATAGGRLTAILNELFR